MKVLRILSALFLTLTAMNTQVFANTLDQTEKALKEKEKETSIIILDSLTPKNVRIIEYIPSKAVCSKMIHIELAKSGTIQNVSYDGGCSGNTQGIGALIKGMKVTEAIKRLDGIKCRNKGTSCPDQLAKALKLVIEKDKEAVKLAKDAAKKAKDTAKMAK